VDGLRVAYLGATGSLVDTSAQRGPNAVAAMDPITGRVTRRLFILPCTSSEGIAPAADLAGTSVLEIAQAPDSTGRCTDALLRWSEGDSTATICSRALGTDYRSCRASARRTPDVPGRELPRYQDRHRRDRG
jgi:hypothetical protein